MNVIGVFLSFLRGFGFGDVCFFCFIVGGFDCGRVNICFFRRIVSFGVTAREEGWSKVDVRFALRFRFIFYRREFCEVGVGRVFVFLMV